MLRFLATAALSALAAGQPPEEVLVPGSVYNAIVGLFNLWPAPVAGPPARRRRRLHAGGGDSLWGVDARAGATPDGGAWVGRQRERGEEGNNDAVEDDENGLGGEELDAADAALRAAVGSMSALAAARGAAVAGSDDRFGLFSRWGVGGAASGRTAAGPASAWGRALHAGMTPPLSSVPLPHHRGTPADASAPGARRRRRLQAAFAPSAAAATGARTWDTATAGGLDALLLDGYVSCWLPPTRLCVLQRLAARNATPAGVGLARLAPCCGAGRRLLRGGADPTTLFDVPAGLFDPACDCGWGVAPRWGGEGANLTDEEVWARVAAVWRLFTAECEFLDATDLLSAPATVFWAPEWCALARWQPHVLATLTTVEPVTAVIPTHGAFERLAGGFPAFWLWLTALPSCRGGFNRAEYVLRLHATPCAFGCGAPPPYDRATATARSLAFGGCSESLTLARVQRSPANATTCVLANAQAFSYPKQYQYPGGLGPWGAGGGGRFEAVEGADDPHGPPARVLAQFTGSDGGTLLVVDRVLRPGGHPLARFPACSLGAALRGAADLQLFSRLLAATGLLGCFDGPGGAADDAGGGVAWRGRGAAGDPPTSCPGGSPWTSRTLFAPTDAAFARLSAGVVAWLFHPDNRPLARLVALTHVLRGDTYLYLCALVDTLGATGGSLQQLTESGAFLTVTGSLLQLALSVGGPPAGALWVARTQPPWTDQEATTGIMHRVDSLLISPDILAVIQATAVAAGA